MEGKILKNSQRSSRLIAGVDEAGRGPIAGAVFAGAVILDPKKPIAGLTDSKKLSEKQRNHLFDLIKERAIAWAIGRADHYEIDSINILQASLLAMQRAVAALSIQPHHAIIDGNVCPTLDCTCVAIIKGDETEPAISAASIIAKVLRDREMVELDSVYPGYGLAIHKGYPTKAHIKALDEIGISEIHRRSFKPVYERLQLEKV